MASTRNSGRNARRKMCFSKEDVMFVAFVPDLFPI